MQKIFEGRISTNDIMVDVGCGKGRILNYWISNFPKNKIFGIELDPLIAKKVARRLKNYKNVTILSGKAQELIPDNASIFYLFNPFNCNIMSEFKESLVTKYFAKNTGWSHSFSIIYYNPSCAKIYSDDSRFICSEIEMPIGAHKCLLINQASLSSHDMG